MPAHLTLIWFDALDRVMPMQWVSRKMREKKNTVRSIYNYIIIMHKNCDNLIDMSFLCKTWKVVLNYTKYFLTLNLVRHRHSCGGLSNVSLYTIYMYMYLYKYIHWRPNFHLLHVAKSTERPPKRPRKHLIST